MEPNDTTTPQKTTPKRFDVTLAGPHEHGGTLYAKGDEITLREDQVKRLEQHHLIASKKPAKDRA